MIPQIKSNETKQFNFEEIEKNPNRLDESQKNTKFKPRSKYKNKETEDVIKLATENEFSMTR